jgi:hypothetical protein
MPESKLNQDLKK